MPSDCIAKVSGTVPVYYGGSVANVGAPNRMIRDFDRAFSPSTGVINVQVRGVAEYPRYYTGDTSS